MAVRNLTIRRATATPGWSASHAAGEEPARPPELPGDPGRRGDGDHGAAAGQDHPARQRHEQCVGGTPLDHRRQLIQQGPPGHRHRQARAGSPGGSLRPVTGIGGRAIIGAFTSGAAVLPRPGTAGAGREAARDGRLASQGSLTASDDHDQSPVLWGFLAAVPPARPPATARQPDQSWTTLSPKFLHRGLSKW